MYASGHIHDFEYIYPTYNATPLSTAGRHAFAEPRAPVHLVTGNGGPPSKSSFHKIEPYSFVHSTVYSYTRLVAHNATHMTWTQVANQDSSVLEELTVTQHHHGPFPVPTATRE